MKKLLIILVVMFSWCNVAAALQLVCTSDDKSDWNYIYIDTENNVGAIGNNVGKLSFYGY
jgi:hypothetical protein